MESCLTRVTKLELQQQQQQVVQLEGVENANARALLGKFINVILALMAVLLVFVSTIANFITPLMKTRMRLLSTTLLVLFLFLLWKHWDSITYLLEHVLLLPSWFPWQPDVCGWLEFFSCREGAEMRRLLTQFLCLACVVLTRSTIFFTSNVISAVGSVVATRLGKSQIRHYSEIPLQTIVGRHKEFRL